MRRTPDEDEGIAEQTEIVFKNFLHERLSVAEDPTSEELRGRSREAEELLELTVTPNNEYANIGRSLGKMGDGIFKKYEKTFDRLLDNLDVDASSVHRAFANIAEELFRRKVTWGRVIALLLFGCKMVARFVSSRANSVLRSFFRTVIQCIIEYLPRRWITEHGGWGAAVTPPHAGVDWKWIVTVVGVVVLTGMATLSTSR